MQNVSSKLLVGFITKRFSLLSCRLQHNRKTLYDVLKLKRDCTDQEIRNAFLELSKEDVKSCEVKMAFLAFETKLSPAAVDRRQDPNHPDVKGSGVGGTRAENEKFINILNAYQVLGKKDSRARYDADLSTSQRYTTYAQSTAAGNNQAEPTNWYMRYGDLHPTPDPDPGPYYGVKGVSRVSNLNIAAILALLALIGVTIQFFMIRHSVTFTREALDDHSRAAGEKHAEVRADAEKYGNAKQLERLAEKWLQQNNR